MQTAVRLPAVAGSFYPADAGELAALVDRLLASARPDGPSPIGLIAPHAGYVYSGPIAATAYKLLADRRGDWRRVVLLGPSHFVPLDGIAVPSCEAFRTPLGDVAVDLDATRDAVALPAVEVSDRAHAREHSLEVHLPFLQRIANRFELVPLVCGVVDPKQVADLLEALVTSADTVVVCSTDLSHYQDYDTARHLDRSTCNSVERLDAEAIAPQQACGSYALNGLLTWARRQALAVTTLDLRNSGDTAGPQDRVVGYGAWALAPR